MQQNIDNFSVRNLVTLVIPAENLYGKSGIIGGDISESKPKIKILY